jgi:monoterpene epsilon-lactone hydrolase
MGSGLFFAIALQASPVMSGNDADQAKDRWNFPAFVSEEQRKVFEGWVPYWETPSGTFPAADDYQGWLEKRAEKNSTPVIKALNEKVTKDYKASVKEISIDGVRVLDIRPQQISNPDSVIIYSHPGGLYAQTADLLLIDAIPMAHDAKVRFLSIDYTKIPGPPKGLTVFDQRDEVVKVYKHVVEELGISPKKVGMYSCSAGSTLTVAAINKLSREGYAMPGAIAPNAGVYDWATQGDTWWSLAGKDPILSVEHYIVPLVAMMGINPRDPAISPVYDNFQGRDWPATMLFAGGREMLLSDTLNLNQRLKEAGHDSEANVFDGMGHCWPNVFHSPEAVEMRRQFIRFMTEEGVLEAPAS